MKRIIIMAAMVIAASLVSCGGSEGQTATQATVSSSESGEKDTSASQAGIERVIGTYVGVHGSGLVLHDDGAAEYYWKEWPSVESVAWRYEDNTVTVMSDNIGYEFYAKVPDGPISSLTFEADSESWDEEAFLKISDETKRLGKDDFVELIEDTLKTKLLPAATVKCGQLTLQIPGYYSEQDGYYIAGDKDTGAFVAYASSEIDPEVKDKYKELSDEEFDSLMSEMTDAYMETCAGIFSLKDRKQTSSMLIEHQGYYIERITTEGIFEDEKNKQSHAAKDILYFIYDQESASAVWCLYIPKDAVQYETDFDNMMKEAIDSAPVIKGSIPGQKNTASGKAEAPAGTRSAVIEAIDSYEAFIDEYIELMEEIKNNPSNTSLLSKYADYMTKYADMAKKFEAMEDDEMTDEEALYYAEASLRINKKLLNVIK